MGFRPCRSWSCAVVVLVTLAVLALAACNQLAPPPSPPELWRFSAGTSGAPPILSAVVADQAVYATSYDNLVYALDTETGDILWSFEIPGVITSPDTVVDSGVVYASGEDALYALDGRTGELLWVKDGPDDGYATVPTVTGSTIYTGFLRDYNGRYDLTVSALDAVSGEQMWSRTGLRSSTVPLFFPLTAVGNNVYVSDDHTVHALSAETGTLLWSAEILTQTPPTAFDGKVYFVTNHTTAQAFNEMTGELLWSYEPVITGITSYLWTPIVVDGIWYFPADELHALDAETGLPLWSADVYQALETLVVADGMVFATSTLGDFYALDTATGDVAWTHRRAGGRTQVADGVVYSHSILQHELHALDISTGQPFWSFSGAYYVGGETHTFAVSGNAAYVSYDGTDNGIVALATP